MLYAQDIKWLIQACNARSVLHHSISALSEPMGSQGTVIVFPNCLVTISLIRWKSGRSVANENKYKNKQKNRYKAFLCQGFFNVLPAKVRIFLDLWKCSTERTERWCTDQFETRTSPSRATPRAYELFTLVVVKFTTPGPKIRSNAPRQGWIQWSNAPPPVHSYLGWNIRLYEISVNISWPMEVF